MLVLALSNIDAIGWICFAVGVTLIVVGALNGIGILPTGTPAKAQSKLEDAKQKIDETKGHATRAVAGGGSAEGVLAAEDSAEEAKSALEQVQGIIGALPENLRFSGLLVLVGTVLVSVATIQFGHTSLF